LFFLCSAFLEFARASTVFGIAGFGRVPNVADLPIDSNYKHHWNSFDLELSISNNPHAVGLGCILDNQKAFGKILAFRVIARKSLVDGGPQ
jgi:hypothetical protein